MIVQLLQEIIPKVPRLAGYFRWYLPKVGNSDFNSNDMRGSVILLGKCLHIRLLKCITWKSMIWISGLKVNDQLVASATRFSAVRLNYLVWSQHRTFKAKVQCNFSGVYSPDHSNVLQLINMTNTNIDITQPDTTFFFHHCVVYSSSLLSFISHWILQTRMFIPSPCSVLLTTPLTHANKGMKHVHVLLAKSIIKSKF